ncbi:MAG: DUF1906 domain-containing protein [Gemmatimonadetes bacterium]|nr:DUF1906 domain-containing protein [Gemmatimonadota bacterium]
MSARTARAAVLAAFSPPLVAGALALSPARAPAPPPALADSVPGFDTRVYPGDGAMARWKRASPYRWVGYYLPAPCQTGTSWVGRRAALRRMGWGLAVVFIGEQDWRAMPADASRRAPTDSAGRPGRPVRCTRANLSAARGAADAAEATRAAAADGFPKGTVIYLDVERVDSVSAPLEAYVRGWTAALLDRGRYRPALYAHGRNAESLYGVLRTEYARRGLKERPRLWVASAQGVDPPGRPAKNPPKDPPRAASARPNIWQRVLNTRQTFGGVTLTIDVNVADRVSPSE